MNFMVRWSGVVLGLMMCMRSPSRSRSPSRLSGVMLRSGLIASASDIILGPRRMGRALEDRWHLLSVQTAPYGHQLSVVQRGLLQ